MCYYIAVLKPVNNNIAGHIIDGDNWEAITGLFHDLKCYSSDHEETNFAKQEAQYIASTVEFFLTTLCYIKDNKTYTYYGDNQIYSAKQGRALLPFLKQCNGFVVHYIDVESEITDDYD